MIRTIATTFVRQRLASGMRLALLAAVFSVGLFTVLLGGSLQALDKNAMGMFGFVLAAGILGQEVASGVLTLAFARPIRRADYVLGRWLGACVLATALIVVQILVASLIVIAVRQQPVTGMQLLSRVVEGALASAGGASVLLLFSSLVTGLGDLALYAFAMIIGGALSTIGAHEHSAVMIRMGEEVNRFVGAAIDLGPWFQGAYPPWFSLASYASTIAICLAGAIWALNRKQLSYAAG